MDNAEAEATSQMAEASRWYRAPAHDVEVSEAVLRQREQHLQLLVDTLPTMVWAAEPTGEPSYLNKRLIDYVGIVLNDLDAPDRSRLQMAITSSVHPDDAAAVGQALGHSFATGAPFAMKYRQRRADGVYRWTDGRAEPLRDASGEIVQWYGVSFDIDDEVRSAEALRRAHDKLALSSQAAGLAELAASIAHEVNQPLAAILASANALERWLMAGNPERALQSARSIMRDASAAAEVVARIRALFKGTAAARQQHDLNSIVGEVAGLLQEDLQRWDIAVELDLGRALPAVTVDRVQIQQVLVNLLRNGIEAMEKTPRGRRAIGISTRQVAGAVEVEIRDTGSGVDAPERIFDPFYSTKSDGMGMGLAICRSIIEAHGGKLWTKATGPEGTSLVFTLPIVS
ncbi:hypothetical protein VW23_004410 [Devosia insulae DS-56]|uniref:histidine kinase n=1 Tax=Devosia insulae DS-56 TaxID=1116389 RepID=A0A1E5XIU3_9HYPH|nr:PAS domain-containing sensor histidine kinase [Devosia insulae]OEO28508.1 hypothetical protein VW23_004410 [Devosia insulae DS-56]